MNEGNTVLVAILIIVGVFIVSYFGDYSGQYVRAKEVCEIKSDGLSIYNPQIIYYDSDPNDGVIGKTYRSRCVSDNVLSAVNCILGDSPERYNIECPRDYICFDDPYGAYCKVGTVEKESGGCTDSDGGGNIYEKGTVIVEGGRGYSIPEMAEDRCATDVTVFEATCASGGKEIKKEVLLCPYPYKCSDGACS